MVCPTRFTRAIGACKADCDPTLIGGLALSRFDGVLDPTTCGPANYDAPNVDR